MLLLVLRGGQGHSDVAGSLVDRGRPAERARAEAAQRRALIDGDRGDAHLVAYEVVVVLRIGGGRLDQLLDVARGAPRRELQQRQGLLDVEAADLVGDEAGL